MSYIPADVVDWVLIELRDAPAADQAKVSTRIAQQAAFLKKNGSIVAKDGFSLPEFNYSPTNHLFVIIWHRNHLGIMSADPLVKSGDAYTYDFSTGISQAYGGTQGYKEMLPGVAAMVSADANADGDISAIDKTNYWALDAGKQGYLQTDFNLYGHVDNSDKNLYWFPNYMGSFSVQVP